LVVVGLARRAYAPLSGPSETVLELFAPLEVDSAVKSAANDEFRALSLLAPEDHLVFRTGIQSEIRQDLRSVNQIAYVDAQGEEHSVAVIECLETKPDADRHPQTTRFKWVTNFKVTDKRVITLANQGGRLRWRIENERFNVQKNGGYALEHAYSRDATASKVFYLLLRIAHMLAQLIERGSLSR
jgi:hypothetical protein